MDPAASVIRIDRWCEIFNIPVRYMFDRPRARAMALGFSGMTVADFAMLLVELERTGYRIDPTVLTTPLRAQVTRTPRLTEAELQVLWFDKERHKLPSKTFRCREAGAGKPTHEIELDTGYVVDVDRDQEGAPCSLHVAHPRRKKRTQKLAA